LKSSDKSCDTLLAALDIGTNTVLLLTARPQAGGSFTEVAEHCVEPRLGEGAAATGRLSEDGMARTVSALGDLLSTIPSESTTGAGLAAATSAVRDSSNRAHFLRLCEQALGHAPVVLSGDEEAGCLFLGAVSGLPEDAGPAVTVDVGAGSTEIGCGFRGDCRFRASVDVGCVRLGEKHGLYEKAAPDAVRAARRTASACLEPAVAGGLAELGRHDSPTVVASGGTATTYATMRLGLREWRRDAVHGYVGTTPDLLAAMAELFAVSSAERLRFAGVTPGRAEVLPGGMLILGEVLRLLGADTFRVTTRGLRYGLILRLQAGEMEPTWRW
jgi:exopolyphosphatase/guanosine-5'-triphosphate,3'-diphosphate pyrophosphatase